METHHENGHVRQKVIRYIGKSTSRFSRASRFDKGRISFPESVPDVEYKVKLSRRPTAKQKPVLDATVTPIPASTESA